MSIISDKYKPSTDFYRAHDAPARKKLEDICIADNEVIIDFTDDFHCAVRISKGDSIESVAHRLISMGKTLLEVHNNEQ